MIPARCKLLRKCLFAAVLVVPVVQADTLRLPENGDNVVGSINLTSVTNADDLMDVYIAYDQGYDEMRLANPKVSPFQNIAPEGVDIVIPSQFVLPDTPHEGIVVNIPEMRLYYYPVPKKGEPRVVITHPIGIGREDWGTPHGVTKVVAKIKNPVWVPPESIRKEHASEWGEILPKVVPAGPENPMGLFALKLGIPGYYIHGTDQNKENGIGMRVTHGCIRMYPKDIESLFAEVPIGTPVRVISQPYKVGHLNGRLYLEAHPQLQELTTAKGEQFQQVVNLLIASVGKHGSEIDWQKIRDAVNQRNGVPITVGRLLDGNGAAPAAPVQSADGHADTRQQVW